MYDTYITTLIYCYYTFNFKFHTLLRFTNLTYLDPDNTIQNLGKNLSNK